MKNNNDFIKNWEYIRSNGRSKYILKRAIYFSLVTIVGSTIGGIVIPFFAYKNNDFLLFRILITIIACLFVSYISATKKWSDNEKTYSNITKK